MVSNSLYIAQHSGVFPMPPPPLFILTEDNASVSSWESSDKGCAGTDEAHCEKLKKTKLEHDGSEYKNRTAE
jgi:hypothetical protein